MGMMDFAATETFSLVAETPIGKAAFRAVDAELMEVMEKAGLTSVADSIRAGYNELPKKLPERMREFVDVKHPLKIPDHFLDDGHYAAEIKTQAGVSTQRLVPQIPYAKAEIKVGDIIALDPTIEVTHKNQTFMIKNHTPRLGEVQKLGPKLDPESDYTLPLAKTVGRSQTIALVKLNDKTVPPLNNDLTAVEPIDNKYRYWRNESGAIFNAPLGTTFEHRDLSNFKFMPDMRAIDLDTAKFFSGIRTLSNEAKPFIEKSNTLIEANVQNPERLLYAFSSAPKLTWHESPMLDWMSTSIFNPKQLTDNCMACTAAIIRSLRTGIFTTAHDIAEAVGAPNFGKFETREDALGWFKEAAKVQIVNKVDKFADLKADTYYAMTVKLKSDTADLEHMAFAYRFGNGEYVLFDGQSGVQWSKKSLKNASVAFHELKFVD